MHVPSLLFGVIVISAALGLESHRRRGFWQPTHPTELDRQYNARRQRRRGWTNALVGLMGLMAMTAGGVGRGPVWLVLWAAVPLVLLGTIVMACIDFWQTDRYLHAKLPELERQSLGTHDSARHQLAAQVEPMPSADNASVHEAAPRSGEAGEPPPRESDAHEGDARRDESG